MGDTAASRLQLVNDSETALRQAFDGRLACLWTAMPGIVVDVDFAEMTCSVQPTIQGIVTDEAGLQTAVNLPKLIHCPIVFPQAGGFALTLPLVANDEVLIVWASRSIDAWWQSGGIQKPIEARMHDLSDGFVIPGPCSKPNVISGISSTGAQIRNRAGTAYVEIAADGKVKVVSASEIDITAPTINVTGDVIVTGGLTAASLTTAGALSAATGTIGGVPFGSHKHTGVTTGLSNTGGPVP